MIFFFALSLFLISCEEITPVEKIKKEVVYRHELPVEINGHRIVGFGTIPRKSSFTIKIKYPEGISKQMIRTCNSELIHRNFGDRFEGKLDQISQDLFNCLIQIHAIGKSSKVYEAMFLIKSPFEKLKASSRCNGKRQKVQGTFLCHAYSSSKYQELWFDNKVKVFQTESCPRAIGNHGLVRFTPISKPCVYIFEDSKGQKFNYTLIGYDETRLYGAE